MSRWQRLLGIALLLAAAMVMALYEFSVLGTQPAVTVALLFAILGGSALVSARKQAPSSFKLTHYPAAACWMAVDGLQHSPILRVQGDRGQVSDERPWVTA